MYSDKNDNIKTVNDINHILELFDLDPINSNENGELTNRIERPFQNENIQSNDILNYSENGMNVNHSIEYQGVSKGVIYVMMSLIVIFLLALGAALEKDAVVINQTMTNTHTTEAANRPENYLSNDELRMLTNEVDYNAASEFMGSQYTTNQLKSLVMVFNRLDYDLNKDRKDFKYLLIAAIIHFQKQNGLEVDGKAGPKTLLALTKALTVEKVGDDVISYIKSDSAVVKEYGWNSQKVDQFVYFVSYEFDYDYSYDNGFTMYAYEVNLNNQTVSVIEGKLLEKYRRLGYVD